MRLYELDTFNESRGFAARRPGDEYIDTTNRDDVAVFRGLTLLPPDEDAYGSHEEMILAFQQWEKTAEGTIYDINRPQRNMLAAMIVNMDTPRGLEHYVLFTRDNRVLEGKLTNIPAGLIPGHGGYVMNRQISTSERAGLKPSEVLTDSAPVSPNQVAGLLDAARSTAGDETVDQMQGYLKALAAGNGMGYVIKDGAKNFNLHSKYLGEWASPIGLMTGQFDPKSQMQAISDNLAGGASLSDAKISYGTNVAGELIDSTVIGKDWEIGISSKAKRGGGASASLKGLQDAMVKQADKFSPGFWSKPKNKAFKHVVEIIMGNSGVEGPLVLAQERGIITPAEYKSIRQGISRSRGEKWAPTRKIATLMDDYAAFTGHPNYDPAKHAYAAVLKKLVKDLNDEDYTDTVKEILNHASIVQMYFKVDVKGPDLICKNFDLVWPPRFDGQIRFDYSKTASATEIRGGRLSFKIGKGAALTDEPDPSLSAKVVDKAAKSAAKAAEKKQQLAVGKVVKPGEKDVRDPRVPDTVALGRAKKK